MEKLSALIFSRDSPNKTLALVKDIVDICDQVVIVYSGGAQKDYKKIEKRTKSIKKIDLYRTIGLGYPDPLRAYGLKKCDNKWILYIDTDERISPKLKKDIKTIISGSGNDAFAIKRYENAHLNGELGDFFTWQVRLYNKNKMYYRGLVHEQPIIKGKQGRLENDYYLMHVEELKEKGKNRTDLEYNLIKKYYDRLSYRMLNERMKDYLQKMTASKGKAEKTKLGRLVLGWMRLYQSLTMKRPDDEIGVFDYFLFYSMIEGMYSLKSKDVKYFFGEAVPTIITSTSSVSKFKKGIDSKRMFEISKALNRYGIIKYLKLDNEKIVERLNKKYANRKQGIELLMKLLDDRYNMRYP